jgi:hypothetical protein
MLMAIQRIEGYDRLIFKWWWLIPLVAALIALMTIWRGIVLIALWWKKPRANNGLLFKQLVKLHKLSASEIALFRLLSGKLPSGSSEAILFVDPATWVWKGVEDPKSREMLEKLYAKIFGFPPDHVVS